MFIVGVLRGGGSTPPVMSGKVRVSVRVMSVMSVMKNNVSNASNVSVRIITVMSGKVRVSALIVSYQPQLTCILQRNPDPDSDEKLIICVLKWKRR